MSLRQPTSTLDRATNQKNAHLFSPFAAWLSSLTIGESDRKSSAPTQRELTSDVSVESPGLVQRCVVVQKDHLGFGFTVCGERIKLVQNVRPGGAAVKAGVQEGDRIIKVNGSLVSSMSHQEVVKLIKSGPYVAMTLQGPAPSATSLPLEPLPTDLTSNQKMSEAPPTLLPSGLSTTLSQRITGPNPVQDLKKHATEILRNMLEQEEAELQHLTEEQLRNSSTSLEEQVESAKRRAQQIRVKIQELEESQSQSESTTSYVTVGEGRLSMDLSEGDFETCESPHSSPSSSLKTSLHRRQNSDTQNLPESVGKAQIIGPEEEDEEEDGYSINEVDGPFQDIELLKSRPVHMMVFMRYVFCQFQDPNPLLFYLAVEAYLSSNPKDARAVVPQICSNFLDPDSPMKIKVPKEYLAEIESRLHAQEDIRGPLSDLQQQVLPDIQDQIQDYRNKQMMGLGCLYGEADLQHLDGDPVKEKQILEKQLNSIMDVLSKNYEERSSPLASAVLLYLRNSGIKLRDSKVFPGLSTEKEKWLTFLKTKKLSGTKKEKDGEDKKRNPILKYIGKPRSTSQSTFHVPLSPSEVRHGNVRNIIQQFENHTEPEEGGDAAEPQRLSSSSLGDESMDSPTISVRLARSESLKAQGEGRRRGVTSGTESVPRSRSDVDMEDCGEEKEAPGLRLLQHSTSSSASSNSARSLENPTPPYTPRSRRRSIDSPVAQLLDAAPLEEEVNERVNWKDTVSPQVLTTLNQREMDRQAVIYELFTTEVSHLRTLRVLDQVFSQKMRSVLSSEELACIFPNLPQVYELHASLYEAMKKQRETPIVPDIGNVMLARFEGTAGEEFQEQAAQLCSQQSQALELIKNKQRKDPRFAHIIQDCEASPHCRRLQLKDMLVAEMQRLTKYPLLLDKIIKHTQEGSSDLPLLHRAQACCRGILQAVNEVVRETEHRQSLSQYQRRLDPAPQFKSFDLTTKTMIHEGPLTWRIGKDKQIEIQALLLSDYLVLLQRSPDDRLQLRYPSRWMGGGSGVSGDGKTSFSPLVKLDSLLVRPVATDVKALYVISTMERQIYELVAGTLSEKNTWKDFLEKAVLSAGSTSTLISHGSLPRSSPGLLSASSVSTESSVYTDNSLTEQSDSMETSSEHSVVPNEDTPTDQLEASVCEDPTVGVADAALQDVETLRKLILQDLQEDGWSQDSDDTPTNEKVTEHQRPESLETVLNNCTNEWDSEPEHVPPLDAEKPSVQVIRKAGVAGPSSFSSSSVHDRIPDDVTLPSDQSSESRGEATAQGNMFYLVMPTEQGESITDDANDPPTPTATHFPSPLEELASQQMELEGEIPASPPEANELESVQLEQKVEEAQLQTLHKSHKIKKVDEIFQTIEELMSKLRRLKEIEMAHNDLLKNLKEPSATQELKDQQCDSATASRTPSLYRASGDGKEGSPAELKIQSTGF